MNQLSTTEPREGRTPVEKLPLNRVPNVRALLMNDQAKGQLASVAAAHMKPERMMRLLAGALRTTPKLADCSPMSLLGALMQCAGLGLEPNTVLGHAYLIPFDKRGKNSNTGKWEVVGTDVQLIVGYKGLIDLARRSGHITSISANVHYSDDELWEYEEGTEATLRHRPGPQSGDKLHAYAIAKFKDGGHAYVVLPWAHVLRIRDASQGWTAAKKTAEQYKKPINSPWATHEDEMAKKTAIRALSKYLPLSTEFRDAVEVDGNRADFAAFAANPGAGVEIDQPDYEVDGTAEQVDPDTGEVTQVEDQRAGEVTIEDQKEKETEPRQKRNTQALDRTDKTPHDQRQQRQTAKTDQRGMDFDNRAPSLSDRIQMVSNSVKDLLAEGTPLEEALEMFEAQLEGIKADDAEEHAAMIEEFEDIVAKRDG